MDPRKVAKNLDFVYVEVPNGRFYIECAYDHEDNGLATFTVKFEDTQIEPFVMTMTSDTEGSASDIALVLVGLIKGYLIKNNFKAQA